MIANRLLRKISEKLDLAATLASPTFTGTVVLPSTTSIGTVSNTEISYLDGVTSAIQTQMNTKAPAAAPTFTGLVTLPATITAPLAEYADNAAAVTAGLTVGRFYHTAGAVKIVTA